ncbi:MAG TPA: sigma-70 family RNA polymerase sigma factor [Candidatus Acidoferrum sp.]|nr:sigma-70 family RNA polymerase sigma factor [Candidatus Acidoferrum sp.]
MAEEVAVSDSMAVERTLAGDRDAYRVLVERHSRSVYRMAYRMMGNAHDAEEVVQESFLRGYQKLKQFAGNSNFGTWVYRIAANYAIDRIRQRNADEAKRETRSKPTEDSLEVDPLSQVRDMSPSPERLAGSAQLAERMKSALAELSPAERTAIVMRHWDGCGIEEIAAVLKSNPNATKNTVFRAVQKLRRSLAPYLEGNEARAMGTEG